MGKVKLPFAETTSVSPPSFCRVSDSELARPVTVPPTVNTLAVSVVQVTSTVVTSDDPTVPEPMVTVHI